MDKDLASIQQARDLVARAKIAGEALAAMDQAQIDKLCAAICRVGDHHADELAALAVEETGFGVAAHKAIKNRFAAVTVYDGIKDLKTVGILAQHPELKTIDIGVPVGVIAGLIPSTNPTSTVLYKSMIALKAGNPIVFSPHPGAVKCITRAVFLVAQAVVEAGGPEGCVSCITTPTPEATNALMTHPDVGLILATGGGAMVKAAYSSGTPAIGVGAGNGPAYIDKSADVPLAVKRILDSKTFDNGTICASEQSILVETAMEPSVTGELLRQGAYLLDGEERKKLGAFILRSNGTMNPAIVGRSVPELCKLTGLSRVPRDARVLVAREDGVGEGHPFSHEKLGLILAYYVEPDGEAVFRRSREILHFEGAGHTFSIHAEDRDLVKRLALHVPASRILVNTSSALGGIGATTNLFPALTLGCGAVGGSSSSNNIGPLDLINIKRVAWGVREVEDLKGGEAVRTEQQLVWSEDLMEQLVQEIMQKLR